MNRFTFRQWMAQAVRLTWIALMGVKAHWMRSISTVVGAMGVVAVLVSLLSIARGYEQVLKQTRASDNEMVLMRGASSEIGSAIGGEEVNLVRLAPGVAQGQDGQPLASAEVFTTIKQTRRDNGQAMSVSLRGVEPVAMQLRGLKLIEGRAPQAGQHEVMVGRQAASQFQGLGVGQEIRIGATPWRVVGVFGGEHGLAESEIWADLGALQSSQDRGPVVQLVLLKLAAGTTHTQFAHDIERDPRLALRVVQERDYYGEQTESLTRFVRSLGWGMAILMALGASFAALNTSQASVSSRLREIATLKALGFRDSALMGSIVAESLILALAGAALACAVVWFALDGHSTSTMFFSHNYSQVVFAFDVAPPLLLQATLIAVVIGVAGGWWPASSALRRPVSQSLAERR